MRAEVSLYEDLYKDTNKIAGDLHQIATDAIKCAQEALDSNRKLIKDLENQAFLIDLLLDGIDDKAAHAINEQIESRGMRIEFDEGEWALFIKRDE